MKNNALKHINDLTITLTIETGGFLLEYPVPVDTSYGSDDNIMVSYEREICSTRAKLNKRLKVIIDGLTEE